MILKVGEWPWLGTKTGGWDWLSTKTGGWDWLAQRRVVGLGLALHAWWWRWPGAVLALLAERGDGTEGAHAGI
jgi:hypothetical protein